MLAQVTATADAITGKEHLAWQELLYFPGPAGPDAGAQASDDKRHAKPLAGALHNRAGD